MSPAEEKLDVLLDIELPVTLRFGRTQMLLGDVIALGSGSVVEFDRSASDPVEVMVNGRVVARGEAVMVQGNYGVRVAEIMTHPARPDPDPPSLPPATPEANDDSQE
jgi:flagellar motor switch protein FliN